MRFKREPDLETMCLNVIVDNIDKFLKEDYEPNEPVGPQLEFLRRLYSDRLCAIIRKDQCISSSYVDFFLSPYWKDVRIRGSDLSTSRLITKLRIMGTAITSLNLKNAVPSADILTAIICCVPNIVYLNLANTECNDSVLAFISKTCSSLVTLNVQACLHVTDVGMTNLCNIDSKEVGFCSLKALNIEDTSVTSDSIPLLLKYLTSLQYLKYEFFSSIFYNLHKSLDDSNHVKYNLRSLEHQHSQKGCLNKVLETWALFCPEVTRIYIEDDVDESHLQVCNKFQNLKIVKFLNGDSTIREGPGITFYRARGEKLTEMHLKCATVSVKVLTEQCLNLKKLTLESVSFDDFDEKCKLQGLNNLKILSLIFFDLKMPTTFKSIEFLITTSINLTKLAITYAENFVVDVAHVILRSPQITFVDFSFTDIKLETLLLFFSSENIMKICVDGCPYSSGPVEYEIFRFVNLNPHGSTVSWKIDYHSNSLETYWRWYEPKWAGELSI